MNVENLIFYQIYPRSFCDANADGEGDIQGVLSKISHLKSLGVNAVWISPCFQSPNEDNGYDISDYCKISESFGTMAEFEKLIKKFHENGIKVVLDFVANHTSTKHEWFEKARKSKKSVYHDYYIWRKTPPNDWQSVFGGSAWAYDETARAYYLHSYAVGQADLNWENPRVRAEMQAVVDFWIDKGVDGFRCDVLDRISKDFEKGKNGNGERLHEYIHELFGRKNTEKLFVVGECWGTTPENVALFCAPERKELTTVFHFQHLCLENGRFSLQKPSLGEVCKRIASWQEQMQKLGLTATVFLENHDLPRSISRFGSDKKFRYECATALAGIVLLHKGVPFLYQGEEIGMTNSPRESIDEILDVESVNYYQNHRSISPKERMRRINFGGRDNARHMIPWTKKTAKGWQARYKYSARINVEKDVQSKKSVYKFYQRLIALRKKYPCFRKGDYRLVEVNEKRYCFAREYRGERIVVLINFERKSRFLLPTDGEILLNNYKSFGKTLKPYQIIVYKNKKSSE